MPFSTLAHIGSGYTEAQLVVLVLAVMVVAVALLSYFVVAPEYEKRLEKQFAAAYAAHQDESTERYLAITKKKLQKHKSLGCWDMEAVSSDDEAYDHRLRHNGGGMRTGAAPISLNAELQQSMMMLSDAQKKMLARRRKSESDALKNANVNRAEMLRRRVLLKKLEEEIKGAIKENDASSGLGSSSAPSSLRGDARRLSNDSLNLTDDRLKMLQEHPADCAQELSVLATQTPLMAAGGGDDAKTGAATAVSVAGAEVDSSSELKEALQTVHDVLSFYLSVDHRDMTKLTVFCNSLLKHDGLNHLRAFEVSMDQDIRTLSNSIIEKAVPAIWH